MGGILGCDHSTVDTNKCGTGEGRFGACAGFYTFAIGSADGFAVLRDSIAAKPAVLGENADWVAMASEYRALATLPGIEKARVWEPKPATIYSWSHDQIARAA